MNYPATIKPVSTGFFVSFPDVPEALTEGKTYDEALAMAADALIVALSFYTEKGLNFPVPSEPKDGQVLICVDV